MKAAWWRSWEMKGAKRCSRCCAKLPKHAMALRTGQPREHLDRDRLRLDLRLIRRIAPDPNARLERLDRERAVVLEMMRDLEARALRLGHGGLDRHVIAEAAGDEEARARVDHRVAGELVGVEHLVLGEPRGGREHRGGGGVEHLEIARVEHDPGGIAFAPLNAARNGVDEVGHYFGAMRSAPSSRIVSPLR